MGRGGFFSNEFYAMKNRILLLFLLSASSCIDRINIIVPDSNASQIVVDGLITDEPGPYTVKLSLSSKVDSFLQFRELTSAKRVTIFDNAGNSEDLTLVEAGTYQTQPNGIRGAVGREYSLRVETLDGKIYESIPDKMSPSGSVDSLYYELESFQPLDAPTQHGFRVYVDAQGVANGDNFFRWKYTGTYMINTYPELHKKTVAFPFGEIDGCYPDPRPCSGFILNEIGVLVTVATCECCVCWVDQLEDHPYVSDDVFISNGKFRNIEIAYVPIEYWPFQIKYRMEVKQMSLSRTAFDYWRTIQSQKEGATSLFQPQTGKTRTNIFERNGQGVAQGIFYASAIKKKQLYLFNENVKGLFLKQPRWDLCLEFWQIKESCLLAFKHSSNKPPADWK